MSVVNARDPSEAADHGGRAGRSSWADPRDSRSGPWFADRKLGGTLAHGAWARFRRDSDQGTHRPSGRQRLRRIWPGAEANLLIDVAYTHVNEPGRGGPGVPPVRSLVLRRGRPSTAG